MGGNWRDDDVHLTRFDNIFITAGTGGAAQAMLSEATSALWEDLGMPWKPKSLDFLRNTTSTN